MKKVRDTLEVLIYKNCEFTNYQKVNVKTIVLKQIDLYPNKYVIYINFFQVKL
jgi:hypothetical protein